METNVLGADADTGTREGLGRSLKVGAVAGTILSLIACTVAMVLGGLEEWGSAFGFGVFVAIWGGLGFGTMFGGVMWASKAVEAEHHAAQVAATPPAS